MVTWGAPARNWGNAFGYCVAPHRSLPNCELPHPESGRFREIPFRSNRRRNGLSDRWPPEYVRGIRKVSDGPCSQGHCFFQHPLTVLLGKAEEAMPL